MGENRRVSTVEPEKRIWEREFFSGTAQELHEAEMPPARRLVRLNSLTRPAVVLGSAQRAQPAWVNAVEQSGIDLARRRSGGGAVWLAPGEQCWIDLWLPASDPLWISDVAQSSWWLGECWAQALTTLAGHTTASAAGATTLQAAAPQVHTGPLLDREFAQIACFAGLGSGEVTVNQRKVVGISQRRSRLGARFQCVVYIQWDPEPLLAVLESTEKQTDEGAHRREQSAGVSTTGGSSGLGSVLRTRVQAAGIAPGSAHVPVERRVFDALVASLPQ
ncbi:MAG: hypothetical protein F2694_08440 [Actinobacteria bacterium]|nr:hypothetical protein [Actinomycetota bacterium]